MPLIFLFVETLAETGSHQSKTHPGKGKQREKERNFGVFDGMMTHRQSGKYSQTHHIGENIHGEHKCGGIELRNEYGAM